MAHSRLKRQSTALEVSGGTETESRPCGNMARHGRRSPPTGSGEFSGWELRDPLGRRVGRVSRVFVDLSGRAVRVEVAMGSFGMRTILLPVDGVGVDRKERALFLRGKASGRSAPAGGRGT